MPEVRAALLDERQQAFEALRMAGTADERLPLALQLRFRRGGRLPVRSRFAAEKA